MTTGPLEIFLAAPPGLEPLVAEEAAEQGFAEVRTTAGGVIVTGGWPEVWRANLVLRGPGRVLVRIGAFHAVHLAQLDKRARRLDWASVLRPGTTLRVDATCERSKIWHGGAAAERIGRAAAEALGAVIAPEAAVRILVRLVDDFCTISLDTSGEPLHRRGAKQAVGKAPMRETLAALFLRACGFRGNEPVVDPMCGSGTFVIEAAERAMALAPGRARGFAFEQFAGFDAAAWQTMRDATQPAPPACRFFGLDRDAGAIEMARANAERAGVAAICDFASQTISAIAVPRGLEDRPGLVIVNPPYGERIGDRDALRPLYGTLGRVLRERFAGWRVGLITSEPTLAHASGLPFGPPGPPVPHGPLRIRLYATVPLP